MNEVVPRATGGNEEIRVVLSWYKPENRELLIEESCYIQPDMATISPFTFP